MSIFDYNKGGIFHAELIFFFFLWVQHTLRYRKTDINYQSIVDGF